MSPNSPSWFGALFWTSRLGVGGTGALYEKSYFYSLHHQEVGKETIARKRVQGEETIFWLLPCIPILGTLQQQNYTIYYRKPDSKQDVMEEGIYVCNIQEKLIQTLFIEMKQKIFNHTKSKTKPLALHSCLSTNSWGPAALAAFMRLILPFPLSLFFNPTLPGLPTSLSAPVAESLGKRVSLYLQSERWWSMEVLGR